MRFGVWVGLGAAAIAFATASGVEARGGHVGAAHVYGARGGAMRGMAHGPAGWVRQGLGFQGSGPRGWDGVGSAGGDQAALAPTGHRGEVPAGLNAPLGVGQPNTGLQQPMQHPTPPRPGEPGGGLPGAGGVGPLGTGTAGVGHGGPNPPAPSPTAFPSPPNGEDGGVPRALPAGGGFAGDGLGRNGYNRNGDGRDDNSRGGANRAEGGSGGGYGGGGYGGGVDVDLLGVAPANTGFVAGSGLLNDPQAPVGPDGAGDRRTARGARGATVTAGRTCTTLLRACPAIATAFVGDSCSCSVPGGRSGGHVTP